MKTPTLKVKIIKAFSFCFIFFTCQLSPSTAQTISLSEPTALKLRPSENAETSILASKGDIVHVLSNTKNWVHLDYKGKKYFTEYSNIYEGQNQQRDSLTLTPKDPACDYGLPYSGSSIFFARPVANFRHSTFLGILFGTHEEYPC
jgi:hypothetical protein